jgi:MbtH protein
VNNFFDNQQEPHVTKMLRAIRQTCACKLPGAPSGEFQSIQTPAGREFEKKDDDMTDRSEPDEAIYLVVMNHEEQYSIWPDDKKIPDGWRAVGTRGSKADCLQYIEETWTDMRPLSLRRRMAERVGQDH